MYNLADKSYQQQPAIMSEEIVHATLTRVREHAIKKNLKTVRLIFHGGEPLLASPDFYRKFVRAARQILAPEASALFSMQTNATLISPEWLELFLELNIAFGISLDGPAEINDLNRVDHQGNGSYLRVVEAIRMVRSDQRFDSLGRKALTVINLQSDPLLVYEHFRSLGFREIDFLFPDGTYDAPPPAVTVGGTDAPYADWLIPIFDQWFEKSDSTFSIRTFKNIIRLILGSERSTENIGGRKGRVVVIETDGGIEPVSALKACGEGFTKAGLNVLNSAIDDVYDAPLFKEYLAGPECLSQECASCPIVTVCGGGYLPHRYKSENGFDNPSIFCRDLTKLIRHIQAKVMEALPIGFRSQLGSSKQTGPTREMQPALSGKL
jgi:uncharacterized protein